MNLVKSIKREILITAIVVIGIAMTFFGLTYAIYFTIEEKNIGNVSFGQLGFDMCLEESCSDVGTTYGTTISGDVYPMNTTEGLSQTPYLFKVSNNGTEEMNVKVYAAKEGNAVDYTNVKIASKVQGTSTYSYGDLTQDVSVLNEIVVATGQSKIIEVYVWLDEEAENDMIGKTISAFVNAIGYYKPEDNSNLHTSDTFIANISAPLVNGRTFEYTGSYQTFEVPITGYYFVETYGAQGGEYTGSLNKAGKGGYSSGYVYLTKGEKLYIYVGGEGIHELSRYNAGGYNGGGASNNCSESNCGTSYNAGGGGATDIRYFGSSTPDSSDLEWDSELGLNSRIMVSGGGGGAGSGVVYVITGGSGGTLIGGTGLSSSSTWGTSTYQPTGGSQSIGGICTSKGESSRGQFGYAIQTSTSSGYGAGGGGGYYGGAPGTGTGGSGGSSFISGYAGANSITSSSSRTHTNNTLHYSGKYFLNGLMKDGVNEGNGKAYIKYIGLLPRTTTKLDNVRYIKDCTKENTVNAYNQWVEIQAIKDGSNIAKNKTVTGTSSSTSSYPYSYVVDGNADDNYGRPASGGLQCVTIDLGETFDLDEVAVWHYKNVNRVFYENVTYVSSDNSTWTEVINESAPEIANGKRINAYSEPLNGYVQDGLLVLYDGISNTGAARSTSTTTWKDLSGNGNNGTITNGTWGDNYLSFNGTSSWVGIGEINPTNFTIGVIFKQDATSTNYMDLVSNWEAGGFGVTTYNNVFRSAVKYNNTWRYNIDTVDLGTSDIYDYFATYDGTTLKTYRNGSYAEELTVGGAFVQTQNGTIMVIGADPAGSSAQKSYFNGKIYSVKIYNTALTDDEIYHNYLIDKEKYGLE